MKEQLYLYSFLKNAQLEEDLRDELLNHFLSDVSTSDFDGILQKARLSC